MLERLKGELEEVKQKIKDLKQLESAYECYMSDIEHGIIKQLEKRDND